jgi:UPF0716 protein FxsA
MVKRMFGLYLVVELAAVIALAYAIGVGWTLLVLVATFALGLATAGSQLSRQVHRLRSGMSSSQEGVGDGVLIALGVVLTVVPGLVTSVLGLVLLLPPTRALARPLVTPLVTALATRGLGRVPVIVTTAGVRPGTFRGRPEYIDGEVIDGEVIDVSDVPPSPLPHLPARPE